MPQNLRPFLYELQIRPFIGPIEHYGEMSFKFDGEIKIHFKCLIPTNKVVLHFKSLKIENYNLTSEGSNDSLSIQSIEYDKLREFVILNLEQNCTADYSYSLFINYTGNISENLYGFYRSSYTDKLNKTFQ